MLKKSLNLDRRLFWILVPVLAAGIIAGTLLSSMGTISESKNSSSDFRIAQLGPSSEQDIYELATTSIVPGGVADVVQIISTGGARSYTVGAGKVLLLTDIVIFPQSPGPGYLQISLIQNDSFREYWVVPNSEPFVLNLTTGMDFSAGSILRFQSDLASAGPIRVMMTGFQVADDN